MADSENKHTQNTEDSAVDHFICELENLVKIHTKRAHYFVENFDYSSAAEAHVKAGCYVYALHLYKGIIGRKTVDVVEKETVNPARKVYLRLEREE